MTASERFVTFFAALNAGARPYPWQCALVQSVADSGRWPDICAPTGSGKSAVVEAHAFLVAEHVLGRTQARPPRRLILVSPRRVLVDDQYDRARNVATRLAAGLKEGASSVLFAHAQALRGLQTRSVDEDEPPPVLAWSLRGGLQPDSGWRTEPAACQVICATPQMWGSRLLLRGYGSTRHARNLEAGLLGQDAVAIVDEAHLHGRLLETARTVAELPGGIAPLQVVSMTATQERSPGQMGISGPDLQDPSLAARVNAAKRLELVMASDWGRELESAVVDCARAELERVGATVGVFVNEVPMALGVAASLRQEGHQVELVCGRMRTADLAALRRRRPGLLSAEGDPEVAFLISTQSLEVGVDLDLPAIVSVIAPASALAQRAGRLNRSGRNDQAAMTVVVPETLTTASPAVGRGAGPYEVEDLVAGLRWLDGLPGSISPLDVIRSELPIPARPLLPRIRATDLETLAMTSDAHAADPEPDLYLLDPSEARPEVSLVARANLDLDPSIVKEALLACPPRQHEQAAIPWSNPGARGTPLGRILDVVRAKAWLVGERDGSLLVERLAEDGGGDPPHPRPGDTVVVPAGSRICTAGVVGLDDGSRRGEPFEDVLQDNPEGRVPDRILPLPVALIEPILDQDPVLGTRAARREVADVLEETGNHEAARRLRSHRRLGELELDWCAGDPGLEVGLLVVREIPGRGAEAPRAVPDESVSLVEHQQEVRERLATIIQALALRDSHLPREELLLAAGSHDEGKRHPRFQRRMGALAGEPPLAKPRPGHRPDRGDGWRHEQLSAAYAAVAADGDPLVTALVGAHHGRGRPLFDRRERDLLDGWDGCGPSVLAWAQRLFGDLGEYELLRARAQSRFGVHGLAWLEALLCCADRQVSAEGR
ncbi:MAG TPA: type I-U CRISPR-associated helicase/endonuclease Cas3 [Solirubrobacteraceae bacterium]|nr:type I-U CRISPR-associated helicase/endonuclease Cas3 [Solirubrobacteraceae bacterium]